MGTAGEQQVALERDLFASLLDASDTHDPQAALGVVLDLLVAVTRANKGYLEVYPSHERSQPQWTISHGCSSEDEAEIRSVTSRGIVTAALAAGTTVHTPYAALDERFAALPSVRDQRLEAVLCVPLGGAGNGILYLEGRRDGGPFATSDVQFAERVARHAWRCVDRLARSAVLDRYDPTAPYRKRLRIDGIVGRSRALAGVFERVELYAPHDVTVLLTGESGTGKTQIARALHDNSPRRAAPFMELNCAAIPESLFESELFGTMAKAITGVGRNHGKVEAAERGTLFLDEIAEIPFSAQGKLLQLLQSRQYHILGSNELTTANVRLIVATNVDLESRIAERRFREDLYYRINVMNIQMPSLAERSEDIAILVDELLAQLARDYRFPALPASPQFRIAMETRHWTGNVRQLRSQLERALIHAHGDHATHVELRHLPGAQPAADGPTFHEATRLYQRELLRRELDACDWNVTQVSERLELGRSQIYNLIGQFGLRRKSER